MTLLIFQQELQYKRDFKKCTNWTEDFSKEFTNKAQTGTNDDAVQVAVVDGAEEAGESGTEDKSKDDTNSNAYDGEAYDDFSLNTFVPLGIIHEWQ